MESFIKAQSANDLVIALSNLNKNLEADFQKERSAEMLKHLNSDEGRIFLKHKIDQIINATTNQILRYLNSSNSEKKGIRADDDLTESEANIATLNESEAQPAETNQRYDANNSDEKLSFVIKLFDAFIAAGLKHSARDLLLGMDEKFSEKLKYNPLAQITSERPFMIIDTAQDPQKSGIETDKLLIDYSSWDSYGDQVINVPETLESFTENYIVQKKINLEPVDKEIQPYLNNVIREFDDQQVDSDSATHFYLKAVQKGYVEEANDFLTRAIQNRFSDVYLQGNAEQGEFEEFTDLLKWAVDKKFFPEKNLKEILISLITETNKLKDDPEKLSAKYKSLESLFDKLKGLYNGNNTVGDFLGDVTIDSAYEIAKRFNNQLKGLKRSLTTTLERDRKLLENSLELDPSQTLNYKNLLEVEKESSEKGLVERLSGMTVPEFLKTLGASSTPEAAPEITQASSSSKLNSQNKTEPSKEDVLKVLKQIYIDYTLDENNWDDVDDPLDYNDYDDSDAESALEDPRSDYIDLLEEIPSLLEKINGALSSSLDIKEINKLGIDLARITRKDLDIKCILQVANESLAEFKETHSGVRYFDPNDDTSFDRFNNTLLQKLITIYEQEGLNSLRFTLENQFVALGDDLKDQDSDDIVDALRLLEIFVNRETEFYKKAPNKELDGSFKFITDERVRNQTIGELISLFNEKKHSGEIRELTPESKTLLNEMINNLYFDDSSPTAADRIAFIYFSLLESNLKKEANIILYNSIADAFRKYSDSHNETLVSLRPVLKYAKENGYLENFKNGEQDINFNKFDQLLQYSLDQNNELAQKYFQQDCLDKIANPKISHQEILRSLELLYSNQGLNNDELKSRYQEALLKRLLPDKKLMSSPIYLENNLPDLMRLAVRGKKLELLSEENFKTFKNHFQAEDLVRLTPAELVKDFFKNSLELINALGSGIENSFKAIQIQLNLRSQLADDPSWIKILNSNTHLINNLESLIHKAFTLENQDLTDRLTVKLREEIPSLEINPDNAAAHLSLLNCIFYGIHDFKNSANNKNLRDKYSNYLDSPLELKENPDEPVDLSIMLIAKMGEALQSFEKLLKQNRTLKRDDFPQSSESKGILKAIGLPLYS
ncbi:MAG: hypothetical protein VKK32_09010 [Candidatus Melainabacteria bacterium]|nr:hypothetical protein [Candidatus Melainabacteria bacterium]